MILKNGIYKKSQTLGKSILSLSSFAFVNQSNLFNVITLVFLLQTFVFIKPSVGSELNFFQLTGIGGSIELGYSIDDIEVKRVDGSITHHRKPVSEQKLDINSDSYIYHPNLLEMKLGVGIEYRKDNMDTSYGSNDSKQKLYSFNGVFDLLKEKPFPVKLYYNQYNPSSSVGLADTVTHENKDYGLILSLNDPIVIFPAVITAAHTETKGEGSGTLVDSEQDYQNVRFTTKGLDNLTAYISLDHSRKKSGSGSFNLPIQTTVNEKYGLDFSSTYKYGNKNRNIIYNKISYDIDEYLNISKIQNARFYSSLSVHHSSSLKSRYSYNFDKTTNRDINSDFTNQDITIGLLAGLTDATSFTGDLDISNEEGQGFERYIYGARSFIKYKTELSKDLDFNTSYLLKYKLSKQASDVMYIAVNGEFHALDNLDYITLANGYVQEESIVVSSRDMTQTYIEGLDYHVTVIGQETRIERLLSGNISDGEVVLIDYQYETGGTYSYGLLNQSISTGIMLHKNYRLSIGYSEQEESLVDGQPIRPLYESQNAYASADARHRVSKTMGLSWRLAIERERGELRPFTRKEADINLTSTLPLINGFTNIHSRYESIDNKLSNEDVNLTLYGIKIQMRTGFRSRLSLKYSIEEDTGGTITRNVKRSELDYLWRWRLLSFRLKGEYNLDEQGDVSRKDSKIFLTLIRNF